MPAARRARICERRAAAGMCGEARATAPAEACSEYASQGTYENGALMCTTAAVYWALSCVCDIVPPMYSAAQMRLLMRTAAATHSGIL